MPTPTSAAPRAKAALFNLFTTDPTLSQIKALWGPPPADQLKHEMIWLGRPQDGQSVTATSAPMISNQVRTEEFTLYTTITVATGGYDWPQKDARVYELFGALEQALRADPQLNAYNGGQPIGRPFQIQDFGHTQSNFPALEGGGASQIVVDIDCEARLRLT